MISYEDALKKLEILKTETIALREEKTACQHRRTDVKHQIRSEKNKDNVLKLRDKMRTIMKERLVVQRKLKELHKERTDLRKIINLHKIDLRLQKMPKYAQLLVLIDEVQPKTIVEIGTWNGKTAYDMCGKALKHNSVLHYIGYDLFEDADDDINERELNVKRPAALEGVENTLRKLQEVYLDFTFELIKGDTNETLEHHVVDFVFVDGGHSIETIRNDYEHVKDSKMIVFDDYYIPDDDGFLPDLEKFGANTLIDDHLNLEVLPPIDDPTVDHTLNVYTGGFACIAVIRNYDES